MSGPFDPGYYRTDELRTFGFKSVGDNVSIAKTCKIVGLDNIEVGDNSRIDDFTTLIATGPLFIGQSVHIHSYCQIGARGGVTLHAYSALASGCLVYSASDDLSGRHMVGGSVPSQYTNPKIASVVMGRHAVAFARTTILPGVAFEEGAVACAHSLVSRTVPAWTIVAGSPAEHRIKRSRRLLGFEAAMTLADKVAA
ncbi:acyltransferase [Qipengyuania sp.]|uniref:acyltransferase n=1 Tax=Qipengyuania sp. TaxID=2004515 RepID=UPI0035C7D3B1